MTEQDLIDLDRLPIPKIIEVLLELQNLELLLCELADLENELIVRWRVQCSTHQIAEYRLKSVLHLTRLNNKFVGGGSHEVFDYRFFFHIIYKSSGSAVR